MPHRNASHPGLSVAAVFTAATLASCLLASVSLAQARTDLVSMRRRAETLRREHRLPEALAAYRAVVTREPTSFEDRFWVAKLESWTGELETAESSFVRLVSERPDDYDTRIALADVRLWRGHPADARLLLEDLRRAHPDDPEVLGRLEALRRTPPATRWEADLEYLAERLPGRPPANGATFSLGARSSDRLRWRGAITGQEKFDRAEYRVGGEAGYRVGNPIELRASAYVAPGAEVLPQQRYGLGLSGKVLHRLVLYADYEFLHFADADVHQAGPRAELYAGRWLIAGQYRYSSTTFGGADATVGNHSGSFMLGYQYGASSLIRLFAGAGAEPVSGPSREAIGEFSGQTIGAGWRHFFTPWTGFELVYAHQDRSDLVDQDSYSVRVVRRW
jgi:YaiO family outer membrane protein